MNNTMNISETSASREIALSSQQLELLKAFSSPTIANAIETFGVRPRRTGVTDSRIRCIFPRLAPIVGYACTAIIESSKPPVFPRTVNRKEYWEYTYRSPGPKVTVVQDRSEFPGGAYWGEVNVGMHKALGSLAVITNGTVRDLDEVARLEFGLFASGIEVSHGHAHLEDFGNPIKIFDMVVNPGDLIHADKHGAVIIPQEIAHEIAEAARRVETCEKPMIEACRLHSPIEEFDRLIPPEY